MTTPDKLLSVVFHTLAIYFFLIIGLRLCIRQMAQLNVVDLIVILVMGSAVETAMVNGDTSLPAGLVCATTLLALNWIGSKTLFQTKLFERFLFAPPKLLIHEGQIIDEHLRTSGLCREDLLEALREREICNPAEVRYCVRERDGSITVVKKGDDAPREKEV